MRVVETRQVLQILVIFMIVQFFGLLLAALVYSGTTYQQVSGAELLTSASSALFYIAYIIIFSAVLVLIMKFYNGDKFFLILEGVAIFISSFFVFMVLSGLVNNVVLFTAYGSAITTNFIVGVIAALVLIVLKNKFPVLRNTATIIASAGIGLVLGISFSFLVALVFMMIMAVYDFIAVFITKHMVTMAKAMSSRNLAFLVGVNEVEAVPKGSFTKSQVLEFQRDMKGVRLNQTLANLYRQGLLPIAARMELGAGDLIIPLMVAIAAYKVFLSFTLSFFIIFGAVAGLLLTAQILKSYKRPLPAIPPLLFGVAAGMLAYALIFGVVPL